MEPRLLYPSQSELVGMQESISPSENSGRTPVEGWQLVGVWDRDSRPLRWLLP